MSGLYSEPTLTKMVVDRFKGVDLSVPEDQMKPYRAAFSDNMIPGAVGEVIKRPGVKYRKTLNGLALSVRGDGIEKMIGGKHPLVRYTEGDTRHVVYYAGGEENLKPIITSYCEPLVVPYKEGWILFTYVPAEIVDTWIDEGYGWWIGGKKSPMSTLNGIKESDRTERLYHHLSAIVLLDVDEPVRVYTDEGNCCIMDEDGNWTAERISPEDPFLTVPIIVQGSDPAGGGDPYRQINLFSPWVTESFCCKTEKTSVFYLKCRASVETDPSVRFNGGGWFMKECFSIKVLAEVPIETINADGTSTTQGKTLKWAERPIYYNGNDHDAFRPSANRIYLAPNGNASAFYYSETNAETDEDGNSTGEAATVTVNLGDGNDNWIKPSPVEGEDNVRITHWRADFGEGFRKLCVAACTTVFGVGGYKDRLFLGGCRYKTDGYPDRIYYSELENLFYIGDLNFLKLEEGKKVMALDGTADTLAALTDQGVYLIGATAQNNAQDTGYVTDALFSVAGHVRAPAPLHYNDTEVLGGEIVYLSGEGVIAIAYKEHFDERFAENRSAMINTQMLKDNPRQLISLGRFLMIRCDGGVWWLLDENQPNSEGNKPYSSHQYEGYRLSGMEAGFAWADDVRLIISKEYSDEDEGKAYICQWESGTDNYYDDYIGDKEKYKKISACWETPWIYGDLFYKNKTFRRLGLLLEAADCNSSVKVEGKKNEKDWETLWDYDGTLCVFDYGDIDYRLFTYSGAPGCPDLQRKIRVKKAKRVKLRFSNDFLNQTLILRQFGLEYEQEE